MERNTWTKKQDEFLLLAIYSLGQNFKWKDVNNILKQTYGVTEKSPKKCRERWNSKLNPQYNTQNWTFQQEQLVLRLQDQIGNKWSSMKQFFPKRTDIFLKNQFYSVFRKTLRKINVYISNAKKRSLRAFTSAIMNNVLTVNQMKLDNRFGIPLQIIELSQQIKSIVHQINRSQNEEEQDLLIASILEPLLRFKQKYCLKKNKKLNPPNSENIINYQQIQKSVQISPPVKQENQKISQIKTEQLSSSAQPITFPQLFGPRLINQQAPIHLFPPQFQLYNFMDFRNIEDIEGFHYGFKNPYMQHPERKFY